MKEKENKNKPKTKHQEKILKIRYYVSIFSHFYKTDQVWALFN